MPLANDVRAEMSRSNQNPNVLARARHFIKNLSFQTAICNPYIVTGAVFVISFFLLIVIQPPFVQHKDPNTQQSRVSLLSVTMMSFVSALVVGVIAYFVRRQ